MLKMVIIFLQVLMFVGISYGQSVGDYLILSDIGQYKLTKGLLFRGRVVGAEPKISRVGNDVDGLYTSYETSYAGGEGYSAPKVEVRVCDSTQWLLHQLDAPFRDKSGIPTQSYYPWQIDSQTVFINAVGGRQYRWLSGNKVVVIEYRGLLTQKPEPLEVIRAYLLKHPSTLSAITLSQLRSTDNKTTWIKDEMDRRLWLCDKWFSQTELMRTNQKKILQEQVKNMNVFLDYREKYFGITAKDEKNALGQYLSQNDSTKIQSKLKAYKDWWAVHKGDSINL